MSDAVIETPAPAADVKNSEAVTDATDEIAAALAAVEAEGEPKEKAEPEPKKEAKDEEPAKEETKDEPKDEEKEPEGPAAKGWAAVRRVEQKLIKRQKEFEQKEQQWQARAAQLDEQMKRIQQREAELDADPVAFLGKKGLSFDDLAKRYLNNGQASPEEIARRASAQQNDTVKQQEERLARIEASIEQREMDAKVNEYRAEIKNTVAAADFELLRAWPDAEAEVLDFADKWAAQHREVLTPRDAALKLQAELQKQLAALSSHQAVRNLLAGANGAQSKQVVSGQSQAPRGSGASPKTLTNNLAATPAAGDPDWESLSEDELIQAALRSVQDA